MTITETKRFGPQTPVDVSYSIRPEIVKMKSCVFPAMRCEMQIPEEWSIVFNKNNSCRVSSEDWFSRTASQIDIYHDRNFFMPAKNVAGLRTSNRIETVSAPREIYINDGRAWLIDVSKNPQVLSDASRERDAIETHCNFNDADGSVWTIIFSAPSASIHRQQISLFERMLSSFRFIGE